MDGFKHHVDKIFEKLDQSLNNCLSLSSPSLKTKNNVLFLSSPSLFLDLQLRRRRHNRRRLLHRHSCFLYKTQSRERKAVSPTRIQEGSPDDASLGFLRSDNARRYVRQLPQCRKQQFSARFPNMSPGAIDLLEKMLVFDPSKRITVEEALCHLSTLHDINDEPVCLRPFSFDFEQSSCTEEHIKALIWRELVKFNPYP
ncbi:LOW QUALITY PROTEIN: hypothetical protein CFOL_v3_29669, partial [Cephalotus follicularis]